MQNKENVERRNWEIRGEKGENNVKNDKMRGKYEKAASHIPSAIQDKV